jgi:hypothetical protein
MAQKSSQDHQPFQFPECNSIIHSSIYAHALTLIQGQRGWSELKQGKSHLNIFFRSDMQMIYSLTMICTPIGNAQEKKFSETSECRDKDLQ